jgi:hypothetical protein
VSDCLNGCGRPARVRGRCKSHYTAFRNREVILGSWKACRSAIGTTRRIRALVAIGYTQAQIARELGAHESWISRLVDEYDHQVNAATVRRVSELYDILSMTPGTSDLARAQAKAKGWAPPLAWDEEAIDDPDATSSIGVRQSVSFLERYTELRELGYNDLQIVGKLDVKPESLLRQLDRYSIKPSADLVAIASSYKRRKSVAS